MNPTIASQYARELMAERHRAAAAARRTRLIASPDLTPGAHPADRPRRFRRRLPVGLLGR